MAATRTAQTQLAEMDTPRLRALTEAVAPSGRVISLYLDLDPRDFGIAGARESAIRSVLDDLGRRIDDAGRELAHDELTALRKDRARISEFFSDGFSAEGAQGLAIFACGPADLWEVTRLPHPVDTQVVIDTVPSVGQLARGSEPATWAVVMVSRERGRVLRGNRRRLVETLGRDDEVHGQHRQGGLSQPRYARSVDREADEHVDAVMDALYRGFRRRRFDHLLVIAGGELWPSIERSLHPDLAPLVAARVEGEVEHSTPEDVLEIARPEMERVDVERERDLLARLNEGLGTGGRGAAGLQPTLDMLVQGRVEALLIAEGFDAPGAVCPVCGWMGADGAGGRCPVDGEALQRRASIVETAVAKALQQDATVVFVRRGDGDAPTPRHLQMEGHGGIAAVLRF
jgi:hypothetical protein